MGRETFLRLPEEKRSRFLKAAWEEFSRVPFAEASINQIVHRAEIPRGSFYQYFESKEDLFRYLLGTTWARYATAYREILRECGRDLFKGQLACYERFLHRNYGGEDGFDRCIQVMRINPGMDMQKMLPEQSEAAWMSGVMQEVDTSALRRQDETFVWQVFLLAMLALCRAVMDTLTHPEREEDFHRQLEGQLDIIRRGSVRMEWIKEDV